MSNAPLYGLPAAWVWTQTKTVDGATLYFARDSRWEPSVPDVVDSSREAVVAYAEACNRSRCSRAHSFFADYHECASLARDYATMMRRPVVIRKVKEYGRPGFAYNLKSNDGSDFLGETILPNEPQSEAQ